jgi:hypothetical protein
MLIYLKKIAHLKANGRKTEVARLILQTFKRETKRSSENLVNFYQTTRCQIKQDITLHSPHLNIFVSTTDSLNILTVLLFSLYKSSCSLHVGLQF